MSKLRKIVVCVSIAGASALAAAPSASAARPIKDQGQILIRVEASGEFRDDRLAGPLGG